MDSAFSLNGFIYTSLQDINFASETASPITSCPAVDSAAMFVPSQAQEYQLQQQMFGAQIENALLSTVSPSTLSSSPSCQPFDRSQNIQTNSHDISMIEASSHSYNEVFSNYGMGTLSPYYTMVRPSEMSRSSSTNTMTCVDPASLILSSSSQSSSVGSSSCFSTPGSRRLSNLSFSGGIDAEDEQHNSMLALFEEGLVLSSPPVPTLVCSSPDGVVSSQDFLMPDGTVWRFNGTALVTVPSAHFSNLTSQSLDESPVLGASSFVGNHALLDLTLSSMTMASQTSMMDYAPFHPHSSLFAAVSEPETNASNRIRKGSLAKKTPMRRASSSAAVAVGARRASSDSAYSSSSCSSVYSLKPSRPRGNMNIRNHHKYRKDGVGEFQCPFDNCTYRYNLRRELNRHRNVHLYAGKDKYRCMNCNSGLCRLDSVKRHMEAKGKSECLKKGWYLEFKENGELVRERKCKASWYQAAAANAVISATVDLA